MKLFEKLIYQTFTQGSAISKFKYFNSPDLIFQHLPVKEKVRNKILLECEKVI